MNKGKLLFAAFCFAFQHHSGIQVNPSFYNDARTITQTRETYTHIHELWLDTSLLPLHPHTY